LGGVYKLSALRNPGGAWEHKVKLSEQTAKITNPGILQVRRFSSDTECAGDAIYDLSAPLPDSFTIVDPLDPTRRKHFTPEMRNEDLLVPVIRGGRLVYEEPTLEQIRERLENSLGVFIRG
jgi:nicotinate phosphoribosyltransferase